jgi:anti-sigma-K factor RskA
MERLLTHDEAQELLGAYAVHALDDDERDGVDSHLVSCPDCSEELGMLLEASAAMGMTDREPPSADLWQRIRTEVRNGSDAAPTKSATAETDDGIAGVIRLDAAREHRRDRQSRWRIAAASAAAAVAVAVPLTLTFSGGSGTSLAALANTAAKQTNSRTIPLLDSNGDQLAEAVLTANGQGYVRNSTLPALPPGQTYQVWFIDSGVPVSSGLLGQAPKVSAFAARADVDAIAISVEPSKGSLAPSTTPVAVGELA